MLRWTVFFLLQDSKRDASVFSDIAAIPNNKFAGRQDLVIASDHSAVVMYFLSLLVCPSGIEVKF